MRTSKGNRGGVDQHTLMSTKQAQRPIAGFPICQHQSEPQRHQQHQRIAEPRQILERKDEKEHEQSDYHHIFLLMEKQETSEGQLLKQGGQQDKRQYHPRVEYTKVRHLDYRFLGNPPLQKPTQIVQQQKHGKQPERPPAVNGSTRRMRVFQKQQEVLPHTPRYRRIQLFIIPHLFFVWV